MNPLTLFPLKSQVRLTDAAKLSPFWRSDPCRNDIGQVIGADTRGNLVVKMQRRFGKVFYIAPGSLQSVNP